MSEINEIKPIGYYNNSHGFLYEESDKDCYCQSGCSMEAVYTKKQMIEFAEDKCWELVNWYVESTGDVNHAAEMKIWIDDEFVHD